MKGTPLAYSVQQAISQRNETKLWRRVSWRTPIPTREMEWQQKKVTLWNRFTFGFLLETLTRRRQYLSQFSEQHLLLESLERVAPPSIGLDLL